jgi:hypothetical protein
VAMWIRGGMHGRRALFWGGGTWTPRTQGGFSPDRHAKKQLTRFQAAIAQNGPMGSKTNLSATRRTVRALRRADRVGEDDGAPIRLAKTTATTLDEVVIRGEKAYAIARCRPRPPRRVDGVTGLNPPARTIRRPLGCHPRRNHHADAWHAR